MCGAVAAAAAGGRMFAQFPGKFTVGGKVHVDLAASREDFGGYSGRMAFSSSGGGNRIEPRIRIRI